MHRVCKEAIANFAIKDNSVLQALLQRLYAEWKIKEPPYPVGGGVVPESPRAAILTVLFIIRPASPEALIEYSSDVRPDVREASADALMRALAEPDGAVRTLLIEGVGLKKVPADVLEHIRK